MQPRMTTRGGERYLHHYTQGWHVIIAPNRQTPKAGAFVGYLTHHRGNSQFRVYGETVDAIVWQLQAAYDEWKRQHSRTRPSSPSSRPIGRHG
jgi:hypothetical protein